MTKRSPRETNEAMNKLRDEPRSVHFVGRDEYNDVREEMARIPNEREEVIEALRSAQRTIRMLEDANRMHWAQLSMLDKILNVVNGRQQGGYGAEAQAMRNDRYDALADRLEKGSK